LLGQERIHPGLNGGIFATTVEHQVRQTMRNLLDNLEEAEMEFSQVVATNVYLTTSPTSAP
jgi:enamine deaminase RidA (YjgF/YER057c/UK114 family)